MTGNPMIYPAADNHVFVSYYDRERALSFCWNGMWEDGRIGICYGGFAEPVVTSIPGPGDNAGLTWPERLRLFEVLCERYIAVLDDIATVGVEDVGVLKQAAEFYERRYLGSSLHAQEHSPKTLEHIVIEGDS